MAGRSKSVNVKVAALLNVIATFNAQIAAGKAYAAATGGYIALGVAQSSNAAAILAYEKAYFKAVKLGLL